MTTRQALRHIKTLLQDALDMVNDDLETSPQLLQVGDLERHIKTLEEIIDYCHDVKELIR